MAGTDTVVAIKKASTWGTAVAVGANDRLVLRSSGVDYTPVFIDNEDLNDSGVQESPETNGGVVEGDINIGTDFTQVPHLLLAAAMMGSTGGAPSTVETGVYLHRLPWNDDTAVILSYGEDLGVDTRGHESILVQRRVITVSPAGEMTEVYSVLGRGIDKALSMGSVTYRDDPTDGGRLRVLERHMTVRANASSGGALSGSDEIDAVGLTITMERPLTRNFQGGNLLQPVRDGWGSVSIELTFHEMSAALLSLLRDARDDKTPLKMDIVFDHGTLLGASENRKIEFYIPKLVLRDAPNVIPGPGLLPFSVGGTCHKAASTPTGFTSGDVQPIVEYRQQEFASDPLA